MAISYLRQLLALNKKNFRLKTRKPFRLVMEIVLPSLFLLLLWASNVGDRKHDMEPAYGDDEILPDRLYQDAKYKLDYERARLATVGNPNVVAPFTQYLETKVGAERVKTFATEAELLRYTRQRSYGTDDVPEIMGAILFDNLTPPRYQYTIRVNATAYSVFGSRNAAVDTTEYGNFREYTYGTASSMAFLTLQSVADAVILDKEGAWPLEHANKLSVGQFTMPIPSFTSNLASQMVEIFAGTFMTIGFMLIATQITTNFVEEKELRIREGMKMMGLKHSILILSWTVTYAFMIGLLSLVISIIGSLTIYKNSSWPLLFFYFYIFGMAIFALSYLISTFVNNTRVVTPVVLVSFLLFYSGLYFPLRTNQNTDKHQACFSPLACMGFVASTLRHLEYDGPGLSMSTLYSSYQGMTVGGAMAILLLDFGIFMLLGMYLDQVLGGDFGVKKPFYFPCMPSFWCGSSAPRESDFVAPEDEHEHASHLHDEGARIEPQDHSVQGHNQAAPEAFVRLRRLRKEFVSPVGTLAPNFVAVRHLSLDMFKGQIYVLLGHNGAGKSTTINMLTGMLEPTSGQAILLGRNIAGNPEALEALRESLGVCPQHDVLYPDLSVLEHMYLFAALKGVPTENQVMEIDTMLDKVGLGPNGDNKVHAFVSTLSGGQKRKLSVAIALLGGSRVVFLDEPSSGMDVNAQRAIWNLLLEERRDRVIVLTTHSMEEAELGDRIGIMSHGSLRCNGSSHFLKTQNGVGYTLTISMPREVASSALRDVRVTDETKTSDSEASNARVMSFMRAQAPFAELVTNAGGELAFRCAMTDAPKFPALFDALDAQQQDLGFVTYGVSVTTLTEVFLKVAEEPVEDEDVSDEATQKLSLQEDRKEALTTALLSGEGQAESKSYDGANNASDLYHQNYYIANPLLRFFSHVKALYLKRFHYAKRDYRIIMSQVVFPALILIPLFAFFSSFLDSTYPSESFSPKRLEPSTLAYNVGATSPAAETQAFMNAVRASSFIASVGDVRTAGLTDEDGNTFENKMLSTVFRGDRNRFYAFDIKSASNLPWKGLPPPVEDQPPQLNVNLYWNQTARFGLFAARNILANGLLTAAKAQGQPASIVVRNHPFDRSSEGAPFILVGASVVLTILLSTILSTFTAFPVRERVEKAKHLQTISGVSGLSYWTANLLWDTTSFLVPMALITIILASYNLETLSGSGAGALAILLALLPFGAALQMYCISVLFNSPSSAQVAATLVNVATCFVLPVVNAILSVFPKIRGWYRFSTFTSRLFPTYCIGDAILKLAMSSFTTEFTDGETDAFSMPILGWNMLYLLFTIPLYVFLLYWIEHWTTTGSCQCFLRAVTGEDTMNAQAMDPIAGVLPAEEDDDVAAERQRVESGQTDDDIVDLLSIRKVYSVRGVSTPHVAVKNLTYGVRRGECFGFLGANGAGKTTTIKILTGDEYPTSGTAKLGGFDILEHPYEVRQMIGYCPQFDALFDKLTAREHLYLYARLKGVPEETLEKFANHLLQELGLMPFADKLAGTYSGGTKRKLSVGVALVGNPAVVFLDEPSTGLDPGARRSMWQLISRTMSNRSVIITTHSMEEAEALCSRIGIMVKGQLACLGSASHLKRKFGRGFQIFVKSFPAAQDAVKQYMAHYFPGFVVMEEHGQNLRFRVERVGNASTIGNVFRTFESRSPQSGIQAYSVSETDLEQLFIHMVRPVGAA